MAISIIVAIADNGVIGKENGLPWKLPGEMAYFKQKTTGHPIIMGRKTHESIGRPLPGRTNIIISRDPHYRPEGCQSATSLDQALNLAKNFPGAEEIFIIGGEAIYGLGLPLADKLYITKVDAKITGDKHFHYNAAEWQEISSEPHRADDKNQYSYTFKVLERIR